MLAKVYSHATDLKMHDRDYWLAPRRLGLR
jgi:hypothetical protein